MGAAGLVRASQSLHSPYREECSETFLQSRCELLRQNLNPLTWRPPSSVETSAAPTHACACSRWTRMSRSTAPTCPASCSSRRSTPTRRTPGALQLTLHLTTHPCRLYPPHRPPPICPWACGRCATGRSDGKHHPVRGRGEEQSITHGRSLYAHASPVPRRRAVRTAPVSALPGAQQPWICISFPAAPQGLCSTEPPT